VGVRNYCAKELRYSVAFEACLTSQTKGRARRRGALMVKNRVALWSGLCCCVGNWSAGIGGGGIGLKIMWGEKSKIGKEVEGVVQERKIAAKVGKSACLGVRGCTFRES